MGCIQVNITGDSIPEAMETFAVQLTTSVDQVNLNPNSVTIIIEGTQHAVHWLSEHSERSHTHLRFTFVWYMQCFTWSNSTEQYLQDCLCFMLAQP